MELLIQMLSFIVMPTETSISYRLATTIIFSAIVLLMVTCVDASYPTCNELSSKINFSSSIINTNSYSNTCEKLKHQSSCMTPEFHQVHQLAYLYVVEHYNQYKTITNLRPLRPFTFYQLLAILTLFDTQKIRHHQFNLSTFVKLTQRVATSTYSNSNAQLLNMPDWRQKEGVILEKDACPEGARCNRETLNALENMGVYDSQFPPIRQYDYTLFLGGSIQEMQLRLISLLSSMYFYQHNPDFQLGTIVALTCDRIIPPKEYKDYASMTFLNISESNGSPAVETGENLYEELTETTAFKGIIYSLQKFCSDKTHFETHRFSSEGYHPSRPVSFLSENSYESLLYERTNKGFFLNENFYTAACQFVDNFIAHTDKVLFFETKQRMSGNERIHRPTTKETVKTWLSQKQNNLHCSSNNQCEFLAVSNAPHIFYQHVAVLQGLEESLPASTKKVYQLASTGAAASHKIPMAYVLDDVTKLFYLEDKHPPE